MHARLLIVALICAGSALAAQPSSGGSSGSSTPVGGGTSGPPPSSTNTYTVSAAADGYVDLPSPVNVALGDDDLSAPISLNGGLIRYFGKNYDQFRVGSNGYILIGTGAGTTATSFVQAGAIAPFWADLVPAAGEIGFELSIEGVLIVEWHNVDVRVNGTTGTYAVRMQLHINLLTSVIEFRYADPTDGLAGPVSSTANTISVADLAGVTSLVVPGDDPGFVAADGTVTAWPSGRMIRFTEYGPQGNSNPVRVDSSSMLPQATPGGAYQFQFTASGASGSYDWLPRAGTSLPAGWQLSLPGLLTISPGHAVAGVYTFWVNAFSGMLQDGKYFQLVIADPLTITSSSPLPAGTENTAYAHTFAATGGVGPYSWTAVGLPTGWSLDAAGNLDAPAGSVMPGQYSFSVTVSDTQVPPATATLPCVLDVVALGAPLVFTTTLPAALPGVDFSHAFTAAGGFPGYTFSATGLPAGFSMSPSGVLSAPGASVITGTYHFDATVEDTQSNVTTSPFTLQVAGSGGTAGTLPGSSGGQGCTTGTGGRSWALLLMSLLAIVALIARRRQAA